MEISYTTLNKTIIDKYTINLNHISVEGWVTTSPKNDIEALKQINESIQELVQK